MTIASLEKRKRRHETVDIHEEGLPDAITEWRNLDRKPSKDDDWLRYARKKSGS